MADLQGTSEAVILVKASPQVGKKHGETVCCAGVDDKGQWVRLYPVTFRTLDEGQQFGRWDKIKFRNTAKIISHTTEKFLASNLKWLFCGVLNALFK